MKAQLLNHLYDRNQGLSEYLVLGNLLNHLHDSEPEQLDDLVTCPLINHLHDSKLPILPIFLPILF